VDGLNLRRIARHLDVNHQSVANWINACQFNSLVLPNPRE
jgi:transposase-like protein